MAVQAINLEVILMKAKPKDVTKMKTLTLTLALVLTMNANAAEIAETPNRGVRMETAEDLAEQIGYDDATMTFDPSDNDERESAVAQGVDCSGDNKIVGIESYDPITRTFEIVDTLCDGQGPFYSTAEAIGEAVPVLWMKTDPKLFLNQSFRTNKPLEFHPTPELAIEERELLKEASLNRRHLRTFPMLRPEKRVDQTTRIETRPRQSPMRK